MHMPGVIEIKKLVGKKSNNSEYSNMAFNRLLSNDLTPTQQVLAGGNRPVQFCTGHILYVKP